MSPYYQGQSKDQRSSERFNTAENIDYEKTSPVRAGANYWVST